MKLIVTSKLLPLLLLEVDRKVESSTDAEEDIVNLSSGGRVERLNAVLEFWIEPEYQQYSEDGSKFEDGLYRFCKDFVREHVKLLMAFLSELTDMVGHLLISHKFKRVEFIQTKTIEVLGEDSAVFIEIS